ncbi:MAG: PAS domain-containing sensor histidine kinase [Pseudomonadota bacterium]
MPSITSDHFRHLAEIRGDVAWIVDCARARMLYLSPAVDAMLGYGHADFDAALANGEGPLAHICAGLPERLRRHGAGDASRRHLVREFEQRRQDGRVVPLEIHSSLMDDGTLVGLIRDISGRRERVAEQKRFASMLNHEFRTPLSTIDGAIQRLEVTGANADEATRGRYRKIAGAVDRLIDMLDDYLSPDRMEAIGRKRIANTAEPLVLLGEAALLARAVGRTVTVDADKLPGALRCEPDGLRLALKVLLDNALQYSPADTVIALSGRRADGGIELLVRDHGPGIDAADQERIFDKFYRGQNAAGSTGSGLGLYMARSVVEVHGGSLTVRNMEKCGAEFRIWLPAHGGAGKKVASKSISSDNSVDQQTRVGARL